MGLNSLSTLKEGDDQGSTVEDDNQKRPAGIQQPDGTAAVSRRVGSVESTLSG